MHHASREHCVATLHLYLSAVCTAPSVHVILMMASRSVARPGVCGYLRLSPGYLQGIFVHRGSPWSRLSPAIFVFALFSSTFFLAISGYLWAISGISLGFLVILSDVFFCSRVVPSELTDSDLSFLEPTAGQEAQMADNQVAMAEPDTQLCGKCGQEIADTSQAVLKGGCLVCFMCNNIYQMLYRHLGGMAHTVQSFSSERQKNFFKTAGACISAVPRNGRWALVKAELVRHMTSFRQEQMIVRVSSEFKPLSVWQKDGYDIELLQAKGEKRTNPVPGLT